MRHETLTVNYDAGASIAGYRIVKHSGDGEVVQAAADSDLSIGVSTRPGAASGDRVDIVRVGIAEVEYGADVVRGDALTSNADGKATSTTTATRRVIGIAEISGASGDIGSVLIAPSIV